MGDGLPTITATKKLARKLPPLRGCVSTWRCFILRGKRMDQLLIIPCAAVLSAVLLHACRGEVTPLAFCAIEYFGRTAVTLVVFVPDDRDEALGTLAAAREKS
jgi:hypothetical protein